MSLCFAFYQGNKILVCADSRVSIEVNGKKYHVTDKYRKIRQFGNKVIFISGVVDVVESVFSSIKNNQTIEDIVKIARSSYASYKANLKSDFDSRTTIQVFTMENKRTVKYQFHTEDDFQIERLEPLDCSIYSAGGRSPEAMDYIIKLKQSNESLSIEEAIAKTFEHFADETIGGNLHWFIIDEHVIANSISKIKESKKLEKYVGNPFPYHCDANGNLVATSATIRGSVYSSSITGSQIIGSNIQGGTITAGTQINVGTDLFVGDNIYLKQGSSAKQSLISAGSGSIDFNNGVITISAAREVSIPNSSLLFYQGSEVATQNWVNTSAVIKFI